MHKVGVRAGYRFLGTKSPHSNYKTSGERADDIDRPIGESDERIDDLKTDIQRANVDNELDIVATAHRPGLHRDLRERNNVEKRDNGDPKSHNGPGESKSTRYGIDKDPTSRKNGLAQKVGYINSRKHRGIKLPDEEGRTNQPRPTGLRLLRAGRDALHDPDAEAQEEECNKPDGDRRNSRESRGRKSLDGGHDRRNVSRRSGTLSKNRETNTKRSTRGKNLLHEEKTL